MVKHQVRPGITGWAQVNGLRGDTSIKERIEYDIYYIEHWSFFFDIQILFSHPVQRDDQPGKNQLKENLHMSRLFPRGDNGEGSHTPGAAGGMALGEPAPRFLTLPAWTRYGVGGILMFLLAGLLGAGAEREAGIAAAVLLAVESAGPHAWVVRQTSALPAHADGMRLFPPQLRCRTLLQIWRERGDRVRQDPHRFLRLFGGAAPCPPRRGPRSGDHGGRRLCRLRSSECGRCLHPQLQHCVHAGHGQPLRHIL